MLWIKAMYGKVVMEVEAKEKVKVIVGNTLEKRFADDFIFDPIVVIPEIDEYGDDYLNIIIVFDGDQANLDPSWTSGFIGRIRPQPIGSGIEAFPVPSFVVKSEWKYMERRLKKWGRLDSATF